MIYIAQLFNLFYSEKQKYIFFLTHCLPACCLFLPMPVSVNLLCIFFHSLPPFLWATRWLPTNPWSGAGLCVLAVLTLLISSRLTFFLSCLSFNFARSFFHFLFVSSYLSFVFIFPFPSFCSSDFLLSLFLPDLSSSSSFTHPLFSLFLFSSHQYSWFSSLLYNEQWRDGWNHIDVILHFLKGSWL